MLSRYHRSKAYKPGIKETTVDGYELTLYSIVHYMSVMEMESAYATSENAKGIAQKHGCRLEFRRAQYEHRIGSFNFKILPYLREDESGIAAVLVGVDKKQLEEARDEIYDKYGYPESIGSHSDRILISRECLCV